MSTAPIGGRLKLAASLVRDGAYLADIGTDHAYLAIELFSEGRIFRAVLSDINKGPLDRARENVEKAGYLPLVDLVLCDGAEGLTPYPVTDYAVLGMGGELIASIVGAAPAMKREGARLILGPMTRPEALRRALYDGGFDIIGEYFVTDTGRHYVTLLAEYSGRVTPYCEADLYFGRREAHKGSDEEWRLYMKRLRERLKSVISGKESGGGDAARERALCLELDERMNLR